MSSKYILRLSTQNHEADKNIIGKARILRKNMTKSEKMLWELLKNNKLCGCHFRKQHPYGIYIIDFFCYKAGLAIEVDGKIHLGKREYDEKREEYLIRSGLRILRFKNEDIESRPEWVKEEIISHLHC
ncbi:MAG TPA: endonuclease domain-containing protein [Bacteroidales bacterium]|nr:endonuclease domain-containing protein [Bacteroidales bacterium]